ncbi:hypothetical protein TK34_22055 (plasmid) [Aeromonas hydrophila]|nr:hypothetical protein TK34_22055 [Aeromonas hydrophila]
MTAAPDVITPRQRGVSRLIGIARLVSSGALTGWFLARTGLEPVTLIALGLLLISVPFHFLTPNPIRLFVRVAGVTMVFWPLSALLAGIFYMASAAAAWIILTTIAVNRHIKRD